MKNFRLEGADKAKGTWLIRNQRNACDVFNDIKTFRLSDFTIYWKSPVTGEYGRILEVVNGERIYTNPYLKLPVIFNKIK